MRALTFTALCLVCCQPIVIGTPGGSGGSSDDSSDGTGGSLSGGASTNGAGAGSVIVSPTTNTGGVGGRAGMTSNGGLAGSTGNLGGAGSSAGGTATASEAGNAGEAGSDMGASGAGGSAEPDEVAPSITTRVLVVSYNPPINAEGEPSETLTESLGLDEPNVLAEELGARLESVTGGHARFSFASPKAQLRFPPTENGTRYTAATYAACLANAANCQAVGVDYYWVDNENEICNLVQGMPVDQVWLLGGKNFGFSIGKQLYCQVTHEPESVTVQLDVVSLDYSDGMQSLLLGYQQHSQSALMQAFGVPAAIATADSPNNTYGLVVQAQGRDWEAPASGCGDVTFAPNSLSANRFDDPRSAPSYCESFLRYPRPSPLDALEPTTCAAWGCTELGFRDYWFAHLPRAPWSDGHDQLNDFWPYILHPAARLPPPLKSATCSSSYEPGWCENAIDGKSGDCNKDEWAVYDTQTPGFVELRFVPPRLVSSVTLTDRACDEQVQAGHLEFSDGSEPIGFGELPNNGKSSVTKEFSPRLLSGLRVVIDFSSGDHPGFGEISVSSDAP